MTSIDSVRSALGGKGDETGGGADTHGAEANRLLGSSESGPEQDWFTVLKNERRRQALRVLAAEDDAYTLSDLAERIASWENEVDPVALTSQQRKRVYVALYQRHLPRMDDLGIVEFDQRSGRVRLTERGWQLFDWYDRDEGLGLGGTSDESWPLRYLAVSVAGAVGLVVAIAGGVPSVWSIAPIVGATLFLSVIHVSGRSDANFGPRRPDPEE